MRTPSWISLLLPTALVLSGCKHVPSEKEQKSAQIHYDLGVQSQATDAQTAYREFDQALKLDPNFVEAHNAVGILLHLAFHREAEAIAHYRQAIALRPGFSEVKVNLANVFLDQKRYDEAIALYEEALNDMLYPTPFIAQGNLGWAYYQKGKVAPAVDAIKASLIANPKFCLGHRNLGTIYQDLNQTEEACKQLGKYRETCPEEADAYFREGVCQAKLGRTAQAKESFATCQAKATTDTLKEDCQRLSQQLAP